MIMSNTLTNNSGNMMYKITVLLFAFMIISAVPSASAQFVVGGGSNSGGAGGESDGLSPLIIDNSITVNQTVLVGGIENEPVVVSTGDMVEFVVLASDNLGVDNITHVEIFTNHDGKRVLNNSQETLVSFKYGDLVIKDPKGLMESVTMDTAVIGDEKAFVFNIIFDSFSLFRFF